MYCFLDTETGGLSSDHSLLSFALVITNDTFEVVRTLSLRTKPDDSVYCVTPGALGVNKINLLEHDAAAVTYTQARADLREFLHAYRSNNPKLTLAGWNVPFDVKFMRVLMPEFEGFFQHRVLDVQTVSKFLQVLNRLPMNLGGLESHIRYFAFAQRQAHEAESDCLMTIAVLKRFIDASR